MYGELILKLKQMIECVNLKLILNIVLGLDFTDERKWKQQNRA